MSRKLICVLLALVLLLGMAACGTAAPEPTPAPTPEPTVEPTPEPTAEPTPEPTPEELPAEEPEGEPETAEETPAPQTFILNNNTKKYHDPSCPSVDDISEKNKSVYEGTREELESRGYVACKRCGGGA